MSLNPLETEAVSNFRKNNEIILDQISEDEKYIKYFLWLMLHIGKMVRNERTKIASKSHMLKEDGSPATQFEHKIESFIISSLSNYFPKMNFLGEETGGQIPEMGLGVAVDPVDGTWSFLSQNNTVSTSLALFNNQIPIMGMILNPATGELGYCYKGLTSRLIQLDVFGENDYAYDLPNYKTDGSNKILINFHPNQNGDEILLKLYKLWKDKKIQMVKSPGGSPAWAILEAAKGNYIYINSWDKTPSKSYDLAAAKLIIEGAGGIIFNSQLKTISDVNHTGMFIAGISEVRLKRFSDLLFP